jgi:hypothetical protein
LHKSSSDSFLIAISTFLSVVENTNFAKVAIFKIDTFEFKDKVNTLEGPEIIFLMPNGRHILFFKVRGQMFKIILHVSLSREIL